jgi:hypothetical protein
MLAARNIHYELSDPTSALGRAKSGRFHCRPAGLNNMMAGLRYAAGDCAGAEALPQKALELIRHQRGQTHLHTPASRYTLLALCVPVPLAVHEARRLPSIVVVLLRIVRMR